MGWSRLAVSANVCADPSPRLSVNKRDRHAVIRELVAAQSVGSQEELRQLLKDRGWDVTQSTLSRDLRELRLVRLPTNDGPRYASPESLVGEDERTLVEDVLPQFFDSVDGVGELLVVKTIYGGAQPVAEAIDSAGWSEVVGTIGGENTVLVICRSREARERLHARIDRLAQE
ncbi:MAG: arginine repressor [Gemmatimonadetes bacterium]|nr:arginine repressor [Gemmatimonadota bacterium]MCC6769607.1 arginine repressor [Gemmatimonadaceae bacterium]